MATSSQVFVFSRFNLYNPGFREAADITDDRYAAWCAHRVDLFRRFTLPSMLGQTFQRYRWLILFDTEPNEHVDQLIADLVEHRNIHPIRFDARNKDLEVELAPLVRREIMRRVRPDTKRVITVRLDTDDAVRDTFLRLVTRHADRLTDEELAAPIRLNFTFGVARRDDGWFVSLSPHNMFAAVVERNPAVHGGELMTAMAGRHTEEFCEIRQVLTKAPQTMMVLHDWNVHNTIRGEPAELVVTDELRAAFNIA